MTRSEFIKKGLALGIGLPFLAMFLDSCKDDILSPQFEINFSGKVLIIGAGAAGLTAGYLLHRNNIEFEIIEASSIYGGRVKRADDFADFPIDLGGEWIHTEPSILSEIISDPTVQGNIDFITYNPQSIYNWKNGQLKKQNWASNFYSEYKFKNTTWYGFFEKYIVPDILDKIRFDSPVNQIDYASNSVSVQTINGDIIQADKVLVTAPIKVLQSNMIEFIPNLPTATTDAINNISMGDGLKVFIEFEEKFYPDILIVGGLISAFTSDGKTFYDAAFRKDTNSHVLGLFTINDDAATYTSLGSDQEIIDKVMSELDEIFDGKASLHYKKHIIQNWSKEPYIQGSYSYNFNGSTRDIMNTISSPLDNKIYFAGEALSYDNQATVHGAAETAYAAVEKILKD